MQAKQITQRKFEGQVVSAAMKKKVVSNIRIESTAGGKLTFLNLFDAKPKVTINGKSVEIFEDKKDIYSVQTKTGDKIQIGK